MAQLRYLTLVLLLLLTPFAPGGLANAQTTVRVAPTGRVLADLLPSKLGNTSAAGPVERLTLAGHGVEDLSLTFNITAAAGRNYREGSAKYRVMVLEAERPAGAYGYYRFTTNRQEAVVGQYGPHGIVTDKTLYFWQGRYVIRIIDAAATPAPEAQTARRQLADAMAERIGGASEPPGIMAHLPEANLVPKSDYYFLGSASMIGLFPHPDPTQIDFTGGTEVAVGQYELNGERGRLMIVEFHTPQLATAGYERLQTYLQSLPPEQRDRIFLKREGNYAVQTVGFANRAAAEGLVNKVKDTYKVQWLSTPKAPYDTTAYRRQAISLLVAIFLLFAIAMVLTVVGGVIFGGSLFVRRRARLQQVYSDAGGMVRLNLDEMVPPALGENQNRLLDKGE